MSRLYPTKIELLRFKALPIMCISNSSKALQIKKSQKDSFVVVKLFEKKFRKDFLGNYALMDSSVLQYFLIYMNILFTQEREPNLTLFPLISSS